MKYLLFALVLFPQLVFSQYQERCFHLEKGSNTIERRIGEEYRENAIFDLNIRTDISGFSISGATTLDNETNSYVRVILRDKYNHDYLLYELYPILADTKTSEFTDMAIETMSLDQVTPKSIIIELKNASIRLDSYSFNTSFSAMGSIQKTDDIQKKQTQHIVNQLNRNLKQRNKTWRAGVTSISSSSYEEKKVMYGGSVPELYGFEHYIGGIFVKPNDGDIRKSTTTNRSSNNYVREFDWRNRHGRNWMTSVKYQGKIAASCWAFSVIGTIEAYSNLYFNRLLYLDLSEQELVSCLGYFWVGYVTDALNYVIENGVVDETCLSYSVTEPKHCSDKCQNPSEIISIDGYITYNTRDTLCRYLCEDTLKHLLLKAPVTYSIYGWHHSVVLAGFKTIQEGDVVYVEENDSIIIDSQSELLGETAWLIKNSRDYTWGTGGYGYIIINEDYDAAFSLYRSITSLLYNDSDIIVEDRDGDGLYFWGIGPKPNHCPSWVPGTPDGDDSDINLGEMNEYGHLDTLSVGITINNPITYSSNNSTSYRIGIVNGGTLTITGTTELTGNGHIRVCEGGTLIVDGGTINNADITLVPGCTIILRNNGKINMANGKNFDAPQGAIVLIDQGEINNT